MKPARSFIAACCLLLVLPSLVAAQSSASAPASDFVWPGPAVPLPGPVAAGVESLRAPALAAHIAFLASPAMEGRGLGTRGLEAAAEYIASSLALAGVPPAGGAKTPPITKPYFQPVAVREITRFGGEVTVERREADSSRSHTFLAGVDCIFPEIAPQTISGPLVFAGYGIRESKPARDDYRGLDVKGKVVVLIAGLPPGPEWQTPEFRSRYAAAGNRQRFAAKLALAASLGAAAVLAVEGPEFPAQASAGQGAPAATFFVPFEEGPAATPPLFRVSRRVVGSLLDDGWDPNASPRSLPGTSVVIRARGQERVVLSRNVIAVIPGADPKLREEAVVVGAHIDHLGRSLTGYYPGADDNASGTSALLEMAEAFAASPTRPKRTLVFAFWTGEEEGHLGSEHYARNPVWPLERTTVYLNLDMIGHPWTAEELKTLVNDARLDKGAEYLARVKLSEFVELGVAEWAPDLVPVLSRAARGLGLAMHVDRTDGKSGGSDYREFARRGRPWVRFFGNYFDGYHEVSDTVENLDVNQVLTMTRLAFASAWLLADR